MTRWKKTVAIKHLITEDDSDEGAQKACHGIADVLERQLPNDFEIEEIVELLRDAQNLEEGNGALELLYDYAHANRIWLGLKGVAA